MDECVAIALVHECCCGNEWDELVLMEITNMNYVERM